MEYKVIKAVDEKYFEKLVTAEMEKGWEPLGGVCFGGHHFIQAMIKLANPQTSIQDKGEIE